MLARGTHAANATNASAAQKVLNIASSQASAVADSFAAGAGANKRNGLTGGHAGPPRRHEGIGIVVAARFVRPADAQEELRGQRRALEYNVFTAVDHHDRILIRQLLGTLPQPARIEFKPCQLRRIGSADQVHQVGAAMARVARHYLQHSLPGLELEPLLGSHAIIASRFLEGHQHHAAKGVDASAWPLVSGPRARWRRRGKRAWSGW